MCYRTVRGPPTRGGYSGGHWRSAGCSSYPPDGAKYAGGKIADGASYVGGKVADGAKYAGGQIADGAKAVGGAISNSFVGDAARGVAGAVSGAAKWTKENIWETSDIWISSPPSRTPTWRGGS